MKCTILDRHEPHCTHCNGPVEIFLYPQDPNQVIEVGFCKNGCREAEICDGKLLDFLGKEEKLAQKEFTAFNRQLLGQLKSNPNICLHDPKCNNKSIAAHSVPKSWLKNLGGKFVYLFRPYLPNAIRPAGRLEQVPRKVSVKKATTSRFCCGKHDKIFNPVDSRSSRIEGRHNLNLLFYRALLSRLHSVLSVKMMLRTHLLKDFNAGMLSPNLDVDGQVSLLSLACSLLRTALVKPNLNWRIRHTVKTIKGKPVIACSNAGDWVSNWVEYFAGPVPKPVSAWGAWGITVIPQYDGHLVVYHHCALDRRSSVAQRHLHKMKSELSFLDQYEGDRLALAVSKTLIVLTEDLCIAPKAWHEFTEEKKSLIRAAWDQNDYVPDGGFANLTLEGVPVDSEKLLNLLS